MRRGAWTVAGVAGAALVWLAAGCADFEGTVDPAFGLPDLVIDAPTLERDVQPIFDRRCAFGGCHSVATRQAKLVLVAGLSHGALVWQPSRLQTAARLVVPGSSSASWLMVMLGPDRIQRAGLSRMPLAAAPLTLNQIATIARWIDRGAPEK